MQISLVKVLLSLHLHNSLTKALLSLPAAPFHVALFFVLHFNAQKSHAYGIKGGAKYINLEIEIINLHLGKGNIQQPWHFYFCTEPQLLLPR